MPAGTTRFQRKFFVAAMTTAVIALGVAGVLMATIMRRQTDERIQSTLIAQARLAADLLSRGALFTSSEELDAEADRIGELIARARALLRRTRRTEPEGTLLTYGSLVMDVATHVVSCDGKEVKLTAKEFLLLQYMLQRRGRVLSRDLLLSDVWGYQYTGGTRTVDVHVRRLREKLPVLVDALVTVKQFGYKLADSA